MLPCHTTTLTLTVNQMEGVLVGACLIFSYFGITQEDESETTGRAPERAFVGFHTAEVLVFLIIFTLQFLFSNILSCGVLVHSPCKIFVWSVFSVFLSVLKILFSVVFFVADEDTLKSAIILFVSGILNTYLTIGTIMYAKTIWDRRKISLNP
ncbi:hypothetical protein J6590_043417 [Homalodisca vitripennis]|nr:hypothetical protein J6590_043417 [Homalodisca vitripennis]